MSQYKQTLNLPKTSFSMKANLAQREPQLLKKWQTDNMYQAIRDKFAGCPTFILHDGPPYANGDIHVGHAVNKLLKDFVIKSKTLSGYDCPYVPGWDCHGLPIELKVEQKTGKVGQKVDAQEFRQKCREYAGNQVARQLKDFERLGIFADWAKPYRTMNKHHEADIVRTLAQIVAQGHLYKGFKPVHWCVYCASSLAEAEVEYIDKTSEAIDVRFPVVEPEKIRQIFQTPHLDNLPVSVLIWTTTPWTLSANQAVAAGTEIDYALVKCQRGSVAEWVIVAKAVLANVMQRGDIDHYDIIGSCAGQDLDGVLLQHPFYQRQVPMILGDHVTVDAGTGLVHTAPAHGEDDYRIGFVQHQLSADSPVGANGCFYDDIELVGGLFYSKANAVIIEKLQDNGRLWQHESITHSYPHCWRHKKPLIFRSTPQWFISMKQQGLRDKALAAIKQVKWIPEWGEARITKMIEGRPDWCISRQRVWGTPLPLFVHKRDQRLHPDTVAIMQKVADKIEQQGMDVWFDNDASYWLGSEADQYDKTTDILDVWFDSGSTNFAVLERYPRLHFPADLYLEGADQHRGWFQTSLLTALARRDAVPYKQVLTHGFAVDDKGRKMSKSLGNVVSPQDVVKRMGADILRLWVASSDYRYEISVSDQVLNRTVDMYRRIRNTTRFLLANLHDFDPDTDLVALDDLLALDRWAINQAVQLQKAIKTTYQQYQFQRVTEALQLFCVNDMGGFYLDVIKDRQYTCQTNSLARRSAQTAMYHIVQGLVRWMAPVLSFTAQEVWQHIPGEQIDESVFLTQWYGMLDRSIPDTVFQHNDWQLIRAVRTEVNKAIETLRHDDKLGSSLEACVTVYASGINKQILKKLQNELRFAFITSTAKVQDASDNDSTSTAKVQDASDNDSDLLTTEIEGIRLHVAVATNQKCERCWHYCDDIGQHAEHPLICGRCVENVVGKGEQRQFA